jgi:soluble lytic murein transglycosylase
LAAALASYNAGENRVAVWNAGFGGLGEELFVELIPYTETRDYVRRITTNAMVYERLYLGKN